MPTFLLIEMSSDEAIGEFIQPIRNLQKTEFLRMSEKVDMAQNRTELTERNPCPSLAQESWFSLGTWEGSAWSPGACAGGEETVRHLGTQR